MLTFLIGMTAATLCTISFLPQVIKIYKAKCAKDISLATFSIFSVGIALWLAYGILLGELPIILANSTALILTLLIVIMKKKYG